MVEMYIGIMLNKIEEYTCNAYSYIAKITFP